MSPCLRSGSGAALVLVLVLSSMAPCPGGRSGHHHHHHHLLFNGIAIAPIVALVLVVEAAPAPLRLTAGQPNDVDPGAAAWPVKPVTAGAISSNTRRMVEIWYENHPTLGQVLIPELPAQSVKTTRLIPGIKPESGLGQSGSSVAGQSAAYVSPSQEKLQTKESMLRCLNASRADVRAGLHKASQVFFAIPKTGTRHSSEITRIVFADVIGEQHPLVRARRLGTRFDPETPGGCEGLVGGGQHRAFITLHTRPTCPLRSAIGARAVKAYWDASIRSSVKLLYGGRDVPMPPAPDECPQSHVAWERGVLDVHRSVIGAGPVQSGPGTDMTLGEMSAAKASGPRLFTLLRDPVERVISEYCHHFKRYQHDRLVCAALPHEKADSTVDQWAQVLAFASVPYQQNFEVAFLGGKRSSYYFAACNDTVFRATQRDLDHLINLIDSQWLVAGITEDYEGSIRTFVRELGWEGFDPDEYARQGKFPATEKHKVENRAREAQIPASVRHKIRLMNPLDSALYRHAVAFAGLGQRSG